MSAEAAAQRMKERIALADLPLTLDNLLGMVTLKVPCSGCGRRVSPRRRYICVFYFVSWRSNRSPYMLLGWIGSDGAGVV